MLMTKLFPGICGVLRNCVPYQLPSLTEGFLQPKISWEILSIRSIIRYHFPRPNERRRVKRHGWKTRMSTPEGRRIIMRRILKGRHVLSH